MSTSALRGVVDRGAISLASLLLTITVARASSADDFGRFAVVYAGVVAAFTAYRAVPGSWLATGEHPHAGRWPPRGSTELAAALGVVAAVVVALSARWVGLGWAVAGALGAVVLPYVLLDAVRLDLYRREQQGSAAVLSVATLLLLGSGAGAWELTGRPGGAWVPTALYAAAHLLVLVAAAVRGRAPAPSVAALRRHVREHSQDSLGQTTNVVVSTAAQVGVPSLLMGVGGSTLVGAVRAAQSLSSIPAQVPLGLQPILLTRLARARRDGQAPAGLLRWWWKVTLVVMVPVLLLSLVVPEPLGRAALGASWAGAEVALPWLVVSTLATQLMAGYESVHRVAHAMRPFTVQRVVGLVLSAGLGALGAWLDGIRGASIGLMTANLLTVTLMALRTRSLRVVPEVER